MLVIVYQKNMNSYSSKLQCRSKFAQFAQCNSSKLHALAVTLRVF